MSLTRFSALALSALLTLAPPFSCFALAATVPAPKTPSASKVVRAVHHRAVSFRPAARRLGIAALARLSSPPPLTLRPGLPAPWEPSISVYGGVAALATGNLLISRPVTGWSALGPGVAFALYANSAGTANVGLGPNWRHSYSASLATSGLNAVLTRSDGRTVTFTGSGGSYTVEAGYDEKLTANADGGWTLTYKDGSTCTFNATGGLTALADADGNATTLTYTGGNLTSVTDASGRSLTLAYTGGKISSVTDPEGRVWGFVYDTFGQLQRVNDPVLNGATYGTEYGYDSSGRVTAVTDRLGKTWSYAYGTTGNYLYTTDPAAQTSGQNTSVASMNDRYPAESVPGYTGKPKTPDKDPETYPDGTVAKVYVEDAAGNPAEFGMDANGRLTGFRDGLGYQTNLQYNGKSCVTQRVAPDGQATDFAYDARRNLTSTTDPTSRTISQTYDADDNVLTRSNAAGTTTNTYDAEHHLLTTTDPTSNATTYAYNANGTMASTTDPAGKTMTYGYDSVGNLILVTDPLSNATSYAYTLDRVTSRIDARSRTTSYTYDAWKRLTAVDYPQSTDQSFTYDSEGRMATSVDGTGSRTYAYNALGFKTTQTDPRGNTSATYDPVGKLTSQTDVTGRLVQYSYDARGSMTGVSDPSSSATYLYDANGRVSKTTYSNGVVSTYGYDNAGRTASLLHKQGSFTTIASYASTYEASGRLLQVTEGGAGGSATTAYGYDATGRLTSENRTGANPYVSTYTYNSRGLRATGYRSENGVASHNGTYSYDNASRLTNVSDSVSTSGLGGTYTWYADGTLTSYPGPGYTRNLDYDEEGHLISIKKGTVLAYEYGYGSDGARRWKKDLATGSWEWYPCGVACCAGELVQLTSTNNGSSWSASRLSVVGARSETIGGNTLLGGGADRSRVVKTSSGVDQQISDIFGVMRLSTNLSASYLDRAKRMSLDYNSEQALRAVDLLVGNDGKVVPKFPPGTVVLKGPRPILTRPIPGTGKIGPGVLAQILAAGACGALYVDLIKTIDSKWPYASTDRQKNCKAVCEARKIITDMEKDMGWLQLGAHFLLCKELEGIVDTACSCK